MALDPAAVSEILRKKAVLLLRRERELFQFRKERERMTVWLDVFHMQSLHLRNWEDGVLARQWATLLVERLGIQAAGMYRREAPEQWALEGGEPLSRMSGTIRFGSRTTEFLKTHSSGCYWSAGTPDPLDELSEQTGFANFLWLHLSIEDQERLLVAGFSKEASPSQSFTGSDQSHFIMLGNHLGALLHSVWLLKELDEERSELQRANGRIRVEMDERLRLERDLRHSQKLEALGRLTGAIGHEINNPLACIIANLGFCRSELGLLQKGLPEGQLAELEAVLEEIADGAGRIARIVRDVKVFTYSSEGNLTPVDVQQALETAIKTGVKELPAGAQLIREWQPVSPVCADSGRLEQVFIHLLTNATQALSEKAAVHAIWVATRSSPDGSVCIEIRDSGEGIAAEIADRVFDPFFTTRPVGKGTGLGLSICKNLVEGFGGRLELAPRPGGGTIARVFLPPFVEGHADAEIA